MKCGITTVALLMTLIFTVTIVAPTECRSWDHTHLDDDLRVRQWATIGEVDECGFVYSTKTDRGRLEFGPITTIVEGTEDTQLGAVSEVHILTRHDVTRGWVASMIFFCRYCHQAISIRLKSGRKQ